MKKKKIIPKGVECTPEHEKKKNCQFWPQPPAFFFFNADVSNVGLPNCSSIHISGTQKKVPLVNIQICAAALVSGVNNDQLTKLLMCLGINSLSENSRKKLTDIIGGKLLDFFDKNMKKYKSKEKELTVKLGLGKEGITLIVDGTYTKRSNGFTMDSPTCLVPQHQFDLISQSHNIDFSQFRHLLRSPK